MQCLGTSSCFELFAKKMSRSSLERLSITVGQRDAPASREETSYLLSLPGRPVFRTLASSSGNKTRPAQLPVPTCRGMAQREIKHPARFLLFSLPPSGKFCQTYGFRKTQQIYEGSWLVLLIFQQMDKLVHKPPCNPLALNSAFD